MYCYCTVKVGKEPIRDKYNDKRPIPTNGTSLYFSKNNYREVEGGIVTLALCRHIPWPDGFRHP